MTTQVGPTKTDLGRIIAVNGTGSDYFATSYSTNWSGIVEVATATGHVTEVSAFPQGPAAAGQPPVQDQVLSAAMYGSWLAWTESYTLQDPWPQALFVWDARTGQVTTLAQIASAPSTGFAGVFIGALSQGALVWSQEGGSTSTINVTQLATLSDRALFQGAVQAGPVIYRGEALFAVGSRDVNHLVAYPLASGAPVRLPAGLRAATDIQGGTLAAGPGAVAWTASGNYASWLWLPGHSRPEELGQASQKAVASGPTTAVLPDSDVLWWDGVRQHLADPRTGSMAVLRAEASGVTWSGYAATDGEQILSARSLALVSKVELPPLSVSLLDVARLPQLPHCPA
ncbi:MAG: hypothetical protein ACREN4_03890 [Candidatus Dormibacteria bacterium]